MEGAGGPFRLGFAFVLALSIIGEILAVTPAPITAFDRNRFKTLFTSALSSDVLEEAAYGAKGYALLNERLPEAEKLCSLVKKKLDPSDVSSIYYASDLVKKISAEGGNCQVSWGVSEETLITSIAAGAKTKILHRAIQALKHFDKQIPKEAAAYLLTALKGDDTPASYAHAFYSAMHLSREDALKVHEMVEDAVAQADEIGDSFYQFADVATTAFVIDSVYSLSKHVKVQPSISDDKVVKFGNYLLDRKQVGTAKEASLVLSALAELTTNKFYIPISTHLGGPVSINEKTPKVVVKVTDLLGNPIKGISVVADSGRHIAENAVILSKKPLLQSPTDMSLFELDLFSLNPAVGFYRLYISSSPAADGVKLLGNQENEIIVKVTTEVIVKDVEILILDKEQGTTLKNIKVEHSKKISLEADFHQKFVLKFVAVDKKSGSPIMPHQTFVRLLNEKTKHEVIYVAEEDSAKTYKFDLDIAAKGKDFNGLSGNYLVDLVVGDAVINNPVSWSLGEVKLTFSDDIPTPVVDTYLYSKRPEINHIFREPEKRPSTVVSNFFTGLVVVPFLLLLVLWIKLGINISNFPLLSPSAILFHLGLGAIFGLYCLYFWSLNMFVTLKYLGILGIPTFVFGHRLLSHIASRKK